MGKGFIECNRCGSIMFCEKIHYGGEYFWVWRCVYCGEYIDSVILENRLLTRTGRAPKARYLKREEG